MKIWDATQRRLLWDLYRRSQDFEACARRFNCTVEEAKLEIEKIKKESETPAPGQEAVNPADLLDAVQTLWTNILQKYNDQGGFMKLLSDLLSRNLEAEEVQDEINLMVRSHGVAEAGKKFHDKYIVIPRAKLKILEQPAQAPDLRTHSDGPTDPAKPASSV